MVSSLMHCFSASSVKGTAKMSRKEAILAVLFCLLLTEIKKSSIIERKCLKYLCAHTKGITFALEKKKEG